MRKLIYAGLLLLISSAAMAQAPTTPGMLTSVITNDTVTGTTVNKLAKLTAGKAIITATTDTDGAIGVVLSAAGLGGSAQIVTNGVVSCVFDGTATAGDYVQISSSVAGDCKDSGSTTRPATGQAIGRVLVGGTGVGTYTLALQIASPTAPTGAAGGSLGGTYPNPTVVTNANLTGDVTSAGNATTLTNAPVIAKVLTGFSAGAGTVGASDSILAALQKIVGNSVLKPTISTALNTGTATGTGGFVSGTYTTPAGVLWLEVVRTVGGGGGSAGSGTTGAGVGTSGGQTCLSTGAACTGTVLINAGGGSGVSAGLSTGGAGGTAAVGAGATGVDVVIGGGGVGGLLNPNGASSYPSTGAGGSSCLGGGGAGGGANSSGGPGAANSGGGGGGTGANAVAGTMSGASGGAGGCVTAIIPSPAASYFYSIGAGGTGGTAGTSGQAGSAGGTGGMKIIEHYN